MVARSSMIAMALPSASSTPFDSRTCNASVIDIGDGVADADDGRSRNDRHERRWCRCDRDRLARAWQTDSHTIDHFDGLLHIASATAVLRRWHEAFLAPHQVLRDPPAQQIRINALMPRS